MSWALINRASQICNAFERKPPWLGKRATDEPRIKKSDRKVRFLLRDNAIECGFYSEVNSMVYQSMVESRLWPAGSRRVTRMFVLDVISGLKRASSRNP